MQGFQARCGPQSVGVVGVNGMEELETSEGTEPKLGCAAWENDDCEGRRVHGKGEGGVVGY